VTVLIAVPTVARVVFVLSCGHTVTSQSVAALDDFRPDPGRNWIATGLWCASCHSWYRTVVEAGRIGRGDL
jgi:hypothetical protein